MHRNLRSNMRRRALLSGTLGLVTLSGLAGCSSSSDEGQATVDRIVLRSDTGQPEQMDLTLVYAPRDGSTERPVWGSYDLPESGDTVIIDDFETGPGFYSLTAHSQTHDNFEVVSTNTLSDAVGNGTLQFEAVIKRSGDVFANLSDTRDTISIPGYSRD